MVAAAFDDVLRRNDALSIKPHMSRLEQERQQVRAPLALQLPQCWESSRQIDGGRRRVLLQNACFHKAKCLQAVKQRLNARCEASPIAERSRARHAAMWENAGSLGKGPARLTKLQREQAAWKAAAAAHDAVQRHGV